MSEAEASSFSILLHTVYLNKMLLQVGFSSHIMVAFNIQTYFFFTTALRYKV